FTTPLSPPPHLLPYTTLFRSRAGSRATGGWPRRSRGGSRRSTRPIPCSTTSRSAINGCRATALTAAIRSSAHPAASSPSAATGSGAIAHVAEYALVVAGVALGSVLAWLIARAFLRAAPPPTLADELHQQPSA